MASSNRHWPSMFKSKPCNTHHQWQHDINHQSLISTGCHRSTPFTSVGGCEERSPEPKPRWNPKPEQIRILEAIFNSGMVNPPRDEIRKIRTQLQEYGQVGDANVFYWFQNRKSRSKHKLRHQHQTSKSQQQQQNPNPNIAKAPPQPNPAPSSSSSSSEKSSPKENSAFSSIGFAVEGNNNLIASPQQSFFQTSCGISTSAHELQAQHHFFGEPFFFPLQYSSPPSSSPPVTLVGPQSLVPQHHDLIMMAPNHHQVAVQNSNIGPCTSLLLSEIMSHHGGSKKDHRDDNDHHRQVIEKDLLELNYSLSTTTTTTTTVATGSPAISGVTSANVSGAPITPVINHVQGVGGEGAVVGSSSGVGAAKSTVFINDVAFEVPVGPFNVREAFGDEAVLINSYGQPVLTNEWGLTLHSLHHGAFYYLI